MRSLIGVAVIAAGLVVGVAPVVAAQTCGAVVQLDSTGVGDESSNAVTFRVTASNTCAVGATLTYSTVEYAQTDPVNATAGEDFRVEEQTTVTLSGLEQFIQVNLIPEQKEEPTEYFGLVLHSTTKGVIGGKPAFGSIFDNDDYHSPGDEPDSRINGGGICWEPYHVRITVGLTHATPETMTIHLRTRDGSAVGGADYVAVRDRVLTIPAGASSVDTTVEVLADGLREHDETFYVDIFNPSTGSVIDGTATVTINSAG